MAKHIRQYLLIGAFTAATVIGVPALAQQTPSSGDRQDQVRHDQQDQNPQVNQDQDQVRRDQDQNQVRRDNDQNQVRRDNDQDRNRTGAYNNGAYGDQDQRWVNTKAYHMGMKDGEHDRAKNKGERADRRHWKRDQDRQAYEAGYMAGYRGNGANDHDRDNQRRER